MKPDIFSTLKYDIVDDISFDTIDAAELDLEEKILYSDEFKALLQEELTKKIDSIPFQKLIDEGVSKQLENKDFPGLINKTRETIEAKIDQDKFRAKFKLTEDLERLSQEIKEKHANIRNILNSQDKYTFGGFAPPNPLTGASGTFLKNTNQTWNGLQWSIGGAAIGSPISGGTADDILFIGPTGLLAQSSNFTWNDTTRKLIFSGQGYIHDDGSSHILQIITPASDGGIEITGGQTAGDVTLSAFNIDIEGKNGTIINDLSSVQLLGGVDVEIDAPLLTVLATNSTFSGNVGVGASLPLRGPLDIKKAFSSVTSVTAGSISFSYNGTATGNYHAASADVFGAMILSYYDDPTYGRLYGVSAKKITGSSNNSGDPMAITFSWTGVSGNVSGYLLFLSDPQYIGSQYDAYFDVGNVTSFIFGDPTDNEDTNLGGSLASFTTVSGGTSAYYASTTGDYEHYGENFLYGPLTVRTRKYATGTADANVWLVGETSATLRMEGPYSKFEWIASTAATDSGHWQIYVNPFGVMQWGMLNDADSAETIFMSFTRSGRTMQSIIFDQNNQGTHIGIGRASSQARLHLPAGTTAASSSPLKFASGSLMTTAEAGAMEYTTPDLFFTPNSAIRYNLPLVTGAGTQGDLVYASGASIYSRLAKDTNSTRYLSNQGTSNNPSWNQINLANGVTGTLAVGNGGTGSTVKNQDNVALTNQSADIGTTNFTSGGVAGTYRVSYSVQDTTADLSAGIITLTLAYTDGAGATTFTTTQALTGTGRSSGSIYLQLASGNVTYAITHTGVFGSAKYALYLTLERLS